MNITRTYTILKTGEQVTVSINIDADELAQQLAARAIHNRSEKAQAMGGIITAHVVLREPKKAG
jgi:hypothetical protein